MTTNVAPTSGLCATGTASSVTGTGPWSWNCTGSNSGTAAQCSALPPSTGGSGSNTCDASPAPVGGPGGYASSPVLNDCFGSAKTGANITNVSQFNPSTPYGAGGTGYGIYGQRAYGGQAKGIDAKTAMMKRSSLKSTQTTMVHRRASLSGATSSSCRSITAHITTSSSAPRLAPADAAALQTHGPLSGSFPVMPRPTTPVRMPNSMAWKLTITRRLVQRTAMATIRTILGPLSHTTGLAVVQASTPVVDNDINHDLQRVRDLSFIWLAPPISRWTFTSTGSR